MLADAGKALKINKNDINALLTRANAYYKLTEHEMCMRHLREGEVACPPLLFSACIAALPGSVRSCGSSSCLRPVPLLGTFGHALWPCGALWPCALAVGPVQV